MLINNFSERISYLSGKRSTYVTIFNQTKSQHFIHRYGSAMDFYSSVSGILVVYISCKPTSLVRDLVILQERGYKLERAVAVDMFPATANCETIAKLVRIKC